MKRASVLIFCGIFVCLLASASVVQAGGFGLFEWGSRAVSMGTANYAVGNDASVVAYNPALMTSLESDHEVQVGFTAIAPTTDVNITGASVASRIGESSTRAQTFIVPHAYYVNQTTDKVALGVGAYTRFGLGTKYDEHWGGGRLLKEIMLESSSITPTAAFQFTDDLTVAVGVEVMNGSMYMKKGHAAGGDATVDVSGTSVAGNLSAHYKFDDVWSMGFVYRTPVNFTGTGSVKGEAMAVPQNGDATVSATFPSSYSLGLGFEPNDDWTLEFSVIWTRWELFEKMKLRYENVNTAWLPDKDEEFFYKNTWRFQLGGEYQATDWLAVRAGYVYDQTPTRHNHASVMLPANDRQLYSFGLGTEGDAWYLDWSAMYITTKERKGMSMDDGQGGTYSVDFKNGKTLISGLSFGYKF